MSKIQEALDKIRAGQPLTATTESAPKGTAIRQRQRGALSGGLPTGMSGTAEIARMEESAYRSDAELVELRMLNSGMSDDHARNAIRELRTSVLQRLETDKRIIMVTSTIEGAGATFVARNLAAAIALDESKTAIIIDCNLKEPSASALAMGEGNIGLCEYLKDTRLSADEIIHRTGVARLRIIPAGTTIEEVREYFTSERLRQLLDELKRRYPERYIVVDAPPIAEAADARILADVCDYVLLVVPFGKSTTGQVIQSARTIGKEKFLGLVFNNKPGMPRMKW